MQRIASPASLVWRAVMCGVLFAAAACSKPPTAVSATQVAKHVPPTHPAAPASAAGAPGGPTPAPTGAPAQATATAAPEGSAAEEGRRVVDLASLGQGLVGSVEIPIAARITARDQEVATPTGLAAQAVRVRIAKATMTMNTYLALPKQFESLEALKQVRRKPKLVATRTFGPGHWVQVRQKAPGQCSIEGISKPTGLLCTARQVPCDAVESWVKVCASLKPGAKPNETTFSSATAFPKLPEAAALVAMDVARAIALNQPDLLVPHVGPDGIRVGKRTLNTSQFTEAAAKSTLLKLAAPAWEKLVGKPVQFNWNGRSVQGDATVYFSSGYGDQPIFTLKQVGERWIVTGFEVEDLGEP